MLRRQMEKKQYLDTTVWNAKYEGMKRNSEAEREEEDFVSAGAVGPCPLAIILCCERNLKQKYDSHK